MSGSDRESLQASAWDDLKTKIHSARDRAEQELESAVNGIVQGYLKRVTGNRTLGEFLGDWSDVVNHEMIDPIKAFWKSAFGTTTQFDTPVPEVPDPFILNVVDRLSRTANPSIPEGAFEQVKEAQRLAYQQGWSVDQLARDIAERLSWEPNKDYWKSVKMDTEAAIEKILDPYGKPGTPAREYARLHDPAVRTLQTTRSEAVDRINADQSTWKARATRIARTEATAGWNGGAMAAITAEGFTHKRWLATHDSHTRPTHMAADRETVALSAPFVVGGSLLQFPGDPTGAADEVINCRCSMIGVKDESLVAGADFATVDANGKWHSPATGLFIEMPDKIFKALLDSLTPGQQEKYRAKAGLFDHLRQILSEYGDGEAEAKQVTDAVTEARKAIAGISAAKTKGVHRVLDDAAKVKDRATDKKANPFEKHAREVDGHWAYESKRPGWDAVVWDEPTPEEVASGESQGTYQNHRFPDIIVSDLPGGRYFISDQGLESDHMRATFGSEEEAFAAAEKLANGNIEPKQPKKVPESSPVPDVGPSVQPTRAESEVKRAVTPEIEKFIQDAQTYPLIHATQPDKAYAILADGKMLAPEESDVRGTFGGSYDEAGFYWEKRNSLYKDTFKTNGNFPKYGFLSVPGTDFSERSYGPIHFIMKDGVKGRSTFTIGDSLNATLSPQPIGSSPTPEQMYNMSDRYELGRVRKGLPLDRFVEVQMYGDITPNDIAKVVITADAPGVDLVKEMAAQRGIPVEVI